MASLYDVAARAGVSKTLVSRLINGQSGVSKVSREKILKAMDELGYVPNALARSLALRATGSIGVVLDSLCEPYFFDFIRGIEDAIEHSKYDVLFCSARNDVARKERNIQFFSEGRADGVIIYGSMFSDVELIKGMSKRTFPFVIVENEVKIPGIRSIIVDNALGGEMAVDHLVSLGCRNIWHFTGDMKRTISLSRMAGYRRGMEKHGLAVSPSMIVASDFEIQTGYRQAKQLLCAEPGALPDGIFFSGDTTAYGALLALREAGIDVPGRIKIVGFDNDTTFIRDNSVVPLTTLGQPLLSMGQAAVEMLIGAIHGAEVSGEAKVFTPELIVRGSTLGA